MKTLITIMITLVSLSGEVNMPPQSIESSFTTTRIITVI